MIKKDYYQITVLSLIAGILYILFNGQLHLFDWDEINFAECAREMIVSGDYLTVQIYFEPFWEKPPLFIWLQVLSMKVFGINEFAARFPNALCGIGTLWVLFFAGKRIKDTSFGFLWAAFYFGSLLPFFFFKSGIIDPWFNLFIFASIFFYAEAQFSEYTSKKHLHIALSGIALGLAVLTKGPAAIVIFGLAVFVKLIKDRFKLDLKAVHIITFCISLILIGGFWFILQILFGNWQTIVDFVLYQIRLFTKEDAGHGGFPGYHFVILLLGVFPASIFAIRGHKPVTIEGTQFDSFKRIMIIVLWVVLILFSIVNTKIVHYSSMCYFPITFLAAYNVTNILKRKDVIKKWMLVMYVSLASIVSIAIFILPFFEIYKTEILSNLKLDIFTAGNLSATSGFTIYHSFISLVLLIPAIMTLIFFKKQKIERAVAVMLTSTALFMFITLLTFPSNIEKYTQNAVIEFYKKHKHEDVYFHNFYKSYAMLFYTESKPVHPKQYDREWLTSGDIDKDVYFVMRNKQKDKLEQYKTLTVLYEKNGFIFCKREQSDTKE